jgi:hypothetical protein
MEEAMKLHIVKGCITFMPVVGVLCLFVFAFAGEISFGWAIFVGLLILSGIINILFFRCPHCRKAIPANSTLNQKYCPLCGEDLGIKPYSFSYYGKCIKDKTGTYRAYSLVGFTAFIVSTVIVLLMVVAILGFDTVFKGVGRIMILVSFVFGILLGMFCRCVAGSAAKLDKEYLYYSRFPFRWKQYSLADIKEYAKLYKPFYHVIRGYVMVTSQGIVAVPVASYKGGQEFLQALTDSIGEPMVDVRPDSVVAKHSEEGKMAEAEYKEFEDNIRKAEEK